MNAGKRGTHIVGGVCAGREDPRPEKQAAKRKRANGRRETRCPYELIQSDHAVAPPDCSRAINARDCASSSAS